MTKETITPAAIDDMARRLVSQDVRYCVSYLVSTLMADAFNEESIMSEDDAFTLATCQPDAGDYRDVARSAGVLHRCTVRIEDDGKAHWYYDSGSAARDDWEEGEEGRVVDAWHALFDAAGLDHPDGSECLEHWLVTDDLARRLREQGESVADDVAGLTIWGRCTSGQAIYMDAVIQRIARAILEA